MSCLGALFSLDQKEVNKLRLFKTDDDRLDFLHEEIEEIYLDEYPDRVAELVQSWDALHRSLTNGKLEYSKEYFPLSHVILGGESIYAEDDYIMMLKTPSEVKLIAEAVERVDQSNLRAAYDKIDPNDYGFPLSDEDFEFTWQWFQASKDFWKLASKENRYVLFTADQ
jgi:hypothetical protein